MSGRSIYVAGGSDEREECQSAIEALKLAGWTVTREWSHPSIFSKGAPAMLAEADVAGVVRASFLWYRAPVLKSEGSAVELGIMIALRMMSRTLARNRAIIVSGPLPAQRIFATMADLRFEAHADALKWLVEYAP